jgi:hypothetical protein
LIYPAVRIYTAFFNSITQAVKYVCTQIFSLRLMSGYIKIMISSRWVVSRYPYHILLVGVKKYGYFLDFYLIKNGILELLR